MFIKNIGDDLVGIGAVSPRSRNQYSRIAIRMNPHLAKWRDNGSWIGVRSAASTFKLGPKRLSSMTGQAGLSLWLSGLHPFTQVSHFVHPRREGDSHVVHKSLKRHLGLHSRADLLILEKEHFDRFRDRFVSSLAVLIRHIKAGDFLGGEYVPATNTPIFHRYIA